MAMVAEFANRWGNTYDPGGGILLALDTPDELVKAFNLLKLGGIIYYLKCMNSIFYGF